MQIEDTPSGYFRNNNHKAAINILFTCTWIQEKTKAILGGENITPQQLNILQILKQAHKPLSTLKIRQQMLDKMSDTSRIVDRLIKKGVVDKKPSALDKRLVDVTINEKGIALLERVDKKSDDIDNILCALTDVDTDTLNGLLGKIRGNN